MYAPQSDPMQRIMGTGAPGHNFFVGTEACARCHQEEVHVKRDAIAEEVSGSEDTTALTLAEKEAELEKRLNTVEEQIVSVLGMGLGIGGFLGIAGLLVAMRLTGRKEKK